MIVYLYFGCNSNVIQLALRILGRLFDILGIPPRAT